LAAKVDILALETKVNSYMKKLLVCITVIFSLVRIASADPSHDVLAHSSGDWSWFGHVVKSTANNPMETPVSNEQTELFVRHSGPGEQWKPLPVLSGRAVALASRMSQLAVLMSDGQWMTLWSDGSATGQPLPAEGRIKTLADDGTDLWAVGSVKGGLAAANQSVQSEIASTMPTTTMAATPAVGLSNSNAPARLVLFREQEGHWATVAEFPADQITASEDDLSLAVVAGVPMLSFRSSDGGIRTLRFTAEHGWQSSASVKPPTTRPIQNFGVLNDGFKPILWLTTGNAPGDLYPTALLESDAGQPIPLQWPSAQTLDGVPTAIFAGNYVCVFGPRGDKVVEQRYNKTTGGPFETAAELSAPESTEGMVPHWLEVVLLAFLGFTVGANVFRQWSAGERPPEVELLPPAPLPKRFVAGTIDAIPMIAAVIFLLIQAKGLDRNALQNPENLFTPRNLIIACSALAIYLLHTTLSELFVGRTVGKRLLGLKVVTVEGTTPTPSQFLMRNLLRIVDPLVMIIVSPLRQRSADTIANTMVVLVNAKPIDAKTEELKESGTDKSDSH
jgi:uncharacterized RDD family membrane protein YckC